MAGSDLEFALVSIMVASFGSDKLVSLRNSCFLDNYRETEITPTQQ